MFLAACSYMLHPVVAALRKRGIPFHNPYRKSNGFWNPLRSRKKGSSASAASSRCWSAHPDFGDVHRPWTTAIWRCGRTGWFRKEVLKSGMKEKLRQYDRAQTATMEQLNEIFEAGALKSLMDAFGGDCRALLNWWRRLAHRGRPRSREFPANVAAARGAACAHRHAQGSGRDDPLAQRGQADVVYLFPDLSHAGDAQYQRAGAARDSVIRLFYVGATRARETLYICQMATATAVTM